jgi:small membrane protein
MKPIQFVLLAFVLAALAKMIHSYQQRRMRTRNFLFWTLVWPGTAAIIIFPDATSFVAHILGIGRGADLIIYASLLMSFYLIFRIHLMLARLEQEITEIVRAIALERLTAAVDSSAGDGKERGRSDRPQGVSSW